MNPPEGKSTTETYVFGVGDDVDSAFTPVVFSVFLYLLPCGDYRARMPR